MSLGHLLRQIFEQGRERVGLHWQRCARHVARLLLACLAILGHMLATFRLHFSTLHVS